MTTKPREFDAYIGRFDGFLTLSSAGSKNTPITLVEKRALDAAKEEIRLLREALEIACETLEFECGGRCSYEYNPCASRLAINQIREKMGCEK